MKFGTHVSIAGGIENAPLRAKELGCECFQMFTRSPRGGRPPELEKSLLESFFLNCSEVAISDYYVHTPYFINLASGKEELREKTGSRSSPGSSRSLSFLLPDAHGDPCWS